VIGTVASLTFLFQDLSSAFFFTEEISVSVQNEKNPRGIQNLPLPEKVRYARIFVGVLRVKKA